jgi:hypothetical protein
MSEEPKVIIEEDLPSFALAGLTQPLVVRPPQTSQPDQAGRYPSIAPSTLDFEAPESWRPPPRKNGLPIVLAVMGACGTLAALAGVIGVHRWHERQKEDAEYAQKIAEEHRRAAQGTNPVMDPKPVDTTPDLTVDPVPTIDLSGPIVTTKTASQQKTPAATTAQSQPKPSPVVVKTAPVTKATGTGTLKTYSSAAGKAIFVDGKQAGVSPAPVSVSCGMHSIRVGEGKARNVNVPCNGTITVGTPDGD